MTNGPVGVIGGSGLYALMVDAAPLTIQTPYGPHSDGLVVGAYAGREVVFIPRHGLGHALPPHRINYRANVWAMASLGVTQVVASCAAGSLRPELEPGTFVVPDQLVDRTGGRASTFVEQGAIHVGFAEPYCPTIRSVLVDASRASGYRVADSGTMVVIDGPRFSTRAESEWYQQQGWHLVNMTALPEAALARELAICYATVAAVTDRDADVDGRRSVTQFDAENEFAKSSDHLRRVLDQAVRALPQGRGCQCGSALDHMRANYLPPGWDRPNASP